MLDYSAKHFPNVGYLLIKFSEEELLPIRQEIYNIKQNFAEFEERSFTNGLAGNLEKEYTLKDSKLYANELIFPCIEKYNAEFPDYFRTIKQSYTQIDPTDLLLQSYWVNFQKRYEFNPPHNHSGIFSFALWLDIPYNISEELQQGPGRNSNFNVPAHFMFQYTNSLGNIMSENIPADNSMQNCMLFFPSKMIHGVLPFFTSQQYRISVSGNFGFRL